MWREKMIKISWAVLFFNLAVCAFNSTSAYRHYTTHSYGLLAFTIVLVGINAFVAWLQWRNIKRFKQELKDLAWELLKKPAEQLT